MTSNSGIPRMTVVYISAKMRTYTFFDNFEMVPKIDIIKPMPIADKLTIRVTKVALSISSPQPLSPKANNSNSKYYSH